MHFVAFCPYNLSLSINSMTASKKSNWITIEVCFPCYLIFLHLTQSGISAAYMLPDVFIKNKTSWERTIREQRVEWPIHCAPHESCFALNQALPTIGWEALGRGRNGEMPWLQWTWHVEYRVSALQHWMLPKDRICLYWNQQHRIVANGMTHVGVLCSLSNFKGISKQQKCTLKIN